MDYDKELLRSLMDKPLNELIKYADKHISLDSNELIMALVERIARLKHETTTSNLPRDN